MLSIGRSVGARTSDLPIQTAGLAAQVAAGQVKLAFITLGGNDFRDIVTGADPATVLTNGITNTVTAASTLLAANPNLQVAISNVPDITEVPGAQLLLAQNPALAPEFAQVSALIDTYNATLAAQFAGNKRVAIVDENGLFKHILADPSGIFPGITLNTTTPSTDPRHLFVDLLHPGTLGQGLLANAFVSAIDSQFSYTVQPLTVAEIRRLGRHSRPAAPGGMGGPFRHAPVVFHNSQAESRLIVACRSPGFLRILPTRFASRTPEMPNDSQIPGVAWRFSSLDFIFLKGRFDAIVALTKRQ